MKLLQAKHGENLVAGYLAGQGYQILLRNFRHIGFEIDLIVQKEALIAFVEVKWRRTCPKNMEEMFTKKKKTALMKGAHYFLSGLKNYEQFSLRCDFALVVSEAIHCYIEDALALG